VAGKLKVSRLRYDSGETIKLRNRLPNPLKEELRKEIMSIGFHATSKREFEKHFKGGKFTGHATLDSNMNSKLGASRNDFLIAMMFDIIMMSQAATTMILGATTQKTVDSMDLPVILAIKRVYVHATFRDDISHRREIGAEEIEEMVEKAIRRFRKKPNPKEDIGFRWRIKEEAEKLVRESALELAAQIIQI
jgi:hypothetical protein